MDFIYQKHKGLDSKVCKKLIKAFHDSPKLHEQGTWVGLAKAKAAGDEDLIKEELKKKIKMSTDISFLPKHQKTKKWGPLLNVVVDSLYGALEDYHIRYHHGNYCAPIEIHHSFNLQYYKPGEGYPHMHIEAGGLDTCDRLITWMIYLNDVKQKGETAFPYQDVYCKPERGKIVLWPAGYTHPHCGIISPYEDKYILTGWFNFKRLNEN